MIDDSRVAGWLERFGLKCENVEPQEGLVWHLQASEMANPERWTCHLLCEVPGDLVHVQRRIKLSPAHRKFIEDAPKASYEEFLFSLKRDLCVGYALFHTEMVDGRLSEMTFAQRLIEERLTPLDVIDAIERTNTVALLSILHIRRFAGGSDAQA